MQARFGAWVRRGRWSAAALTVLVLIAGSVTSFGAGSVLRNSAERSADRSMTTRTDLMATAVTTQVGRYLDQVRALAASLGALQTITATSYAQVTAPLKPMNLSGATAVSLVVPAADDEVAAVQARWRRQGQTNLTLHPWGHGQHLFSVLTTRLDGQKPAARGLDLTEAPTLRNALDESLRSNAEAVSDTYQLLIDRSLPPARRQHSFAVAAPIYSATRAFRGWVVMGLRGQDFVRTTLTRVAQQMIDVSLLASNADGSQTRVAGLNATSSRRRDLHRRVELQIAQRKWLLDTAAAHSALPGGSRVLATAMSGTLFLLTLLLAALVATLASGRARAQRKVAAATGELRQAEREARDQAKLLGTILDSITDGVGVVDETGHFLLHNPAAKKMLGISEDSEEPDDWSRHYGIFRPDTGAAYPTDELPLVRALHGEEPTDVELMIRNRVHPNGVLLTVSARQLELAEGRYGAVAVFRDVTEERAHEAELAGFAGVVAHDLKSPLATVIGYNELLEETVRAELTGPAKEEALGHLARVHATAARMRDLIDDLLAYTTARDAAIHPVTFSLGDLVHEVVAGRVDASGANRNAGYFPDLYVGPLPSVHADPVLVRQVLENLIGNALKYTPPGQPARVDITGNVQPGRGGNPVVRVEVADRGIGLPPGEHALVFARFHRAHPGAGYAGTGLGLAICQQIVERHGGTIAAGDNPGGGARFWFTLPAAPPEDPAAAEVAELHPAAGQAAGASSGRSSSA